MSSYVLRCDCVSSPPEDWGQPLERDYNDSRGPHAGQVRFDRREWVLWTRLSWICACWDLSRSTGRVNLPGLMGSSDAACWRCSRSRQTLVSPRGPRYNGWWG